MVSQQLRFCRCIKAVKKTLKLDKKKARTAESAAIAICTKTILFPRGRTIKKLRCGKKARLLTQKRK
jgi:hypothetical protein